MKIRGFIIAGITLVVLGVGSTAIASTQIDFDEGFPSAFSDPTLVQKEQTFGAISKITYDGSSENLEIHYSEGNNTFSYYEGEKLTYDITYDEELKTLSIQQNHSYSFLNFSFGFNQKKAVLTINSALEEIDIDSGAGNVTVKDLTISKTNIEVNAANLKIENSNITDLKLESDAGNVHLMNLQASTSKLDVKAGNVKVENSKLSSSTILVNAGNVNLKDTTFETLDAKLNAGNFTLSGDILTRGEFKIDAGNLKLNLERPQSSYTVNAEGNGDTILVYKVSAGNPIIHYTE